MGTFCPHPGSILPGLPESFSRTPVSPKSHTFYAPSPSEIGTLGTREGWDWGGVKGRARLVHGPGRDDRGVTGPATREGDVGNVTLRSVLGNTHGGAFVFCPLYGTKDERTSGGAWIQAREATEDARGREVPGVFVNGRASRGLFVTSSARDVHKSRETSRPSPPNPSRPGRLGHGHSLSGPCPRRPGRVSDGRGRPEQPGVTRVRRGSRRRGPRPRSGPSPGLRGCGGSSPGLPGRGPLPGPGGRWSGAGSPRG